MAIPVDKDYSGLKGRDCEILASVGAGSSISGVDGGLILRSLS